MPITASTLRKFKKGSLFVETGCEDGNGIQAALDAGFANVVSIELNPESVRRVRHRFLGQPVTIIHGDSPSALPIVLNELTEPVTFWLDAHPDTWSPVLQELHVLEQYPLRTHTILIDDRRLMHGAWRGITEDKVIAGLRRVNPEYQISFTDGCIPEDVIVAQVP